MHLLWTWFYGVRCLFKFLHCLPPNLQPFSTFVLSSLHLVKLFSDSPAILQHTNHPHFNYVLLRSVPAVCQVMCSHSIMRLIHHTSHSSLLSTCSSSAPYRHFRLSRTFCLCLAHFKNIMEKSTSLLPILECTNHLAMRQQRPGRTLVYKLPLPSHFNTIIISAFICCCSCFRNFISCA